MRPSLLLPFAACSLFACSARSISPGPAEDAQVAVDAPTVNDAAVALDRPVVAPCTAGRVKSCPCTDGRPGAQTCSADGTFGACVCAVPDAGAPVEDVPVIGTPDAAPLSYDYVINSLLVDEGAEPGATTRAFYGFNLDNRFSSSRTASQVAADCSHGDYFSALDADQNMGTCTAGSTGGGSGCRGGVDNQLPNMVQTIMQFQASLSVQSVLRESIDDGHLVMLLRVSGVNGPLGPTLNDPAVTVTVYPYAWASFTNCASIQAPGQHYTVDNRSLRVAGDLASARFQYPASIVNGRLRVDASGSGDATPTFAIRPPASLSLGSTGISYEVSFYRTQLRLSLGETGGTSGNLGGFMRQGDVIDALVTIPALMQFRDAAGPLIQGFVDVATGTPAACDAPQGGIGVGFGFSTLRAIIDPTTVTGAPPGVCGGAPR
ncbi:MAG: hypothetical protein JWM10_1608 [Myxococcaceae bacterium]|nr:hypothetical protein [Myxococcaceae bacterium]